MSKKDLISGDMGSVYLNAYFKEKIWKILGPYFVDDKGKTKLSKYLYGLITLAHAWYEMLTKAIRNFFKNKKYLTYLW